MKPAAGTAKFTKQHKKMVFNSIFKGTALEQKMVVKFKRGRALWEVSWPTGKGHYLISLRDGSAARYVYPCDYSRLEIIDDEDLMKWLLRNRPEMLPRFFPKPSKRLRLTRKIVPKSPYQDL